MFGAWRLILEASQRLLCSLIEDVFTQSHRHEYWIIQMCKNRCACPQPVVSSPLTTREIHMWASLVTAQSWINNSKQYELISWCNWILVLRDKGHSVQLCPTLTTIFTFTLTSLRSPFLLLWALTNTTLPPTCDPSSWFKMIYFILCKDAINICFQALFMTSDELLLILSTLFLCVK